MKRFDARSQIFASEGGPHAGREDQFGVGAFPQQEVAEALFAAGADEQVYVGAEEFGECLFGGSAVEPPGGIEDGGPRRLIKVDTQIQPLAAGGFALTLFEKGNQGSRQTVTASNVLQTDSCFDAAIGLLDEIASQKFHQSRNFALRAAPVVF
jgi:hypothetical protein